ncbi:MAG: restriction endonuclease subunit S [Nitrospirae bacterium]|nr:restriction endonuclease subunit S [Nitrospirota bacterium]MCL5422723.1 restriction endonuclease subunit S [Nitrospirota bacterium]
MSKAWPKVRLGEVLSHRKEFIDDLQTYKRPRVQLHAQGIIIRDEVVGVLIKTKKQQLCCEGDFLMAEIDAKVGGFGLVPGELAGAIVSSHYFLFVANEDRLDRRYLGWFIKTPEFRKQVEAQGSTNYAAIRPGDVLGYQIPLPPLSEQRWIVARIEQLTAKIEEARRLRRQAAEEAEALFSTEIVALFSKGEDSGWVKNTLGEYVVDCCYGTSEKTTDDDSGTPILRMGNIQGGRLNYYDLKYLHLGETERSRLLLKRGDILVNRTNSAELVGKCAVFDKDAEFAFASYLIRLRLDTTRANPNLVAAYINSDAGRAYMFRERKQMTGQANVNSTKLRALPIVLPPISEQRRIVAYLDDLHARVDSLKRLQTDTAAELDALLPSVLDKAFRGGVVA